MARQYNDPIGGTDSNIGSQFRTDYYQKKALIEARREQYFGQLADVENMPKNMGKTIKRYHYLPLLDDANINSQGLGMGSFEVPGIPGNVEKTIVMTKADIKIPALALRDAYYAVGEGVDDASAVTAAETRAIGIISGLLMPASPYADYAAASAAWIAAGGLIDATIPTALSHAGNLYGSSKDVGYITSKMPVLGETGGRVNRVGFKRVDLEGSIEKYGFFDEYTQESLDFDTDAELSMHINREMVNAANEISEDLLQIDLLNSAGIIRFAGDATQTSDLSGDVGSTTAIVTYADFMRLGIDLDNNRCPKQTKIITGTRMIDTQVIDSTRVMYVGTEVVPMLKNMADNFGEKAFVPIQHYAGGTTTLTGEIGAIDQFRIVVVPEMMRWEGVGAPVTANGGFYETGGNYDVFPMLVVGSESFTQIGFQTDGKAVKFVITNKKPGKDIADLQNPYGEMGFMSIKFYYGFMLLRPERIALVKAPGQL